MHLGPLNSLGDLPEGWQAQVEHKTETQNRIAFGAPDPANIENPSNFRWHVVISPQVLAMVALHSESLYCFKGSANDPDTAIRRALATINADVWNRVVKLLQMRKQQ
jgi:hypothetical protein